MDCHYFQIQWTEYSTYLSPNTVLIKQNVFLQLITNKNGPTYVSISILQNICRISLLKQKQNITSFYGKAHVSVIHCFGDQRPYRGL